MLQLIFTTDFFFSILRITAPILFATLGAVVGEKPGVSNIGLEGTMMVAALFGSLTTYWSGSWAVGLIVALFCGVLVSLLMGFFAFNLKTDIILTGIAVNMIGSGGTLFLDERCDPGVEKVTANQMIYGHDMHDGTMFGKLHLYAGEDYGKEHSLIRFDTLHEVGEYQLLAAFYTQVYYTTDTCFKYYQFFDAENEEEFNE